MIVDAQDLQRAQIDQRVQSLDGVGVVVVQRESAHPDEAVEDSVRSSQSARPRRASDISVPRRRKLYSQYRATQPNQIYR